RVSRSFAPKVSRSLILCYKSIHCESACRSNSLLSALVFLPLLPLFSTRNGSSSTFYVTEHAISTRSA
ncbi:unnamed protein product, partial [Cylicocyclus nassatus]